VTAARLHRLSRSGRRGRLDNRFREVVMPFPHVLLGAEGAPARCTSLQKARGSRGRLAERRRRRLDQLIVKIRISASEIEAGETIQSAIGTFLSDLLI
jgi:hypothetical protein